MLYYKMKVLLGLLVAGTKVSATGRHFKVFTYRVVSRPEGLVEATDGVREAMTEVDPCVTKAHSCHCTS